LYAIFMNRDELIEKVMDRMFGYGELQYLIDDPTISDIDFNRHNYCTIKRDGMRQTENIGFKNEKIFEDFVKLIITRRGGIINENDSHCRVADLQKRLRINGSIWPRNITGPSLNIRKHPMKSHTYDDLINLKMLDKQLSVFLQKLAKTSSRVIFCGKGAAGKTTLLRTFINSFDELERVLVCESDSELYPDNPSCIVQRVKKGNEGGRPVVLLDLVGDGLTMTLDTYVVGEIVGNESWTVITAGLNGHRILGTLHANSAMSTFNRLVTLIKLAGADLGEATLKHIISDSIDIIVYMKDFKVAEILEVVGFDETTGTIATNLLYLLKTGSTIGELKGRLRHELEGINIDD
ncbi:MAG: Flp pilus assembly complex ATPase component TadA, partial [Actinobacteria bacterium]|nr:Flp pilus assembly complex ATPase component TadA [Actinomycetota bacterium]